MLNCKKIKCLIELIRPELPVAAGISVIMAVIIFSMMLFVFDLGEEIAADAMDIVGDKKRNVKSIPILIGRKKELYISFILFWGIKLIKS